MVHQKKYGAGLDKEALAMLQCYLICLLPYKRHLIISNNNQVAFTLGHNVP